LTPTIGVLALQGDFHEHSVSLRALGAETREVRKPGHLDGLNGLIIPGGESTTIARLMLAYDLHDAVRDLGRNGLPIWGTCAGAILLADDVPGLDRPSLSLFPMTVERNAFGRQIDSFETDLVASGIASGLASMSLTSESALPPNSVDGCTPYHAVFIRAPRIRRVGPDVSVLMAYEDEPVAVRFRSLLATTFHPELTDDRRWHAYFLRSVVETAARPPQATVQGGVT
jgi:5'-phosphate synthase pdxT subunit